MISEKEELEEVEKVQNRKQRRDKKEDNRKEVKERTLSKVAREFTDAKKGDIENCRSGNKGNRKRGTRAEIKEKRIKL